MINLEHITYSYSRRSKNPALIDITAEIGPGIHLLLGENGAGKTTLLHIIAGLRRPVPISGCTIDGVSPWLHLPSLTDRICFVSDDLTFPLPTINEMERRHAVFFPNFSPEMLRRNLEVFGMTGNELIDAFSLGNRKKAQLAYILALRPEVLLLDEPANGLDIDAKTTVLNLLSECIEGNQTVILSTHTVQDFAPLFDSVMMLSGGRLILNMSVWDITERLSFTINQYPPEGAFFMEQRLGRFAAILPRDPENEPTDIDFVLLYKGLQSVSSRSAILNQLS